MRTTYQFKQEKNARPLISLPRSSRSKAVRERIQAARKEILQNHLQLVPGHEHLLTLALNEAEALAFQTDYAHLLFPVLAMEKAEAAVSWHHRQNLIQRNVETAFAV